MNCCPPRSCPSTSANSSSEGTYPLNDLETTFGVVTGGRKKLNGIRDKSWEEATTHTKSTGYGGTQVLRGPPRTLLWAIAKSIKPKPVGREKTQWPARSRTLPATTRGK